MQGERGTITLKNKWGTTQGEWDIETLKNKWGGAMQGEGALKQ